MVAAAAQTSKRSIYHYHYHHLNVSILCSHVRCFLICQWHPSIPLYMPCLGLRSLVPIFRTLTYCCWAVAVLLLPLYSLLLPLQLLCALRLFLQIIVIIQYYYSNIMSSSSSNIIGMSRSLMSYDFVGISFMSSFNLYFDRFGLINFEPLLVCFVGSFVTNPQLIASKRLSHISCLIPPAETSCTPD